MHNEGVQGDDPSVEDGAVDQRGDHVSDLGSDAEEDQEHGGADVRRAWRGSVQRGARGARTIDGADADGVRGGAVSGRRRPQAAPMDSGEAGPAAARGNRDGGVCQSKGAKPRAQLD